MPNSASGLATDQKNPSADPAYRSLTSPGAGPRVGVSARRVRGALTAGPATVRKHHSAAYTRATITLPYELPDEGLLGSAPDQFSRHYRAFAGISHWRASAP